MLHLGGATPDVVAEASRLAAETGSALDPLAVSADFLRAPDLGPVELTSITSYIDRDILVSRDASALTGSVSVDLGYPAGGVLLPVRELPDALGSVVELLPSGALAEGMRTALAGGTPSPLYLVVLLAWALAAGGLATRSVRSLTGPARRRSPA